MRVSRIAALFVIAAPHILCIIPDDHHAVSLHHVHRWYHEQPSSHHGTSAFALMRGAPLGSSRHHCHLAESKQLMSAAKALASCANACSIIERLSHAIWNSLLAALHHMFIFQQATVRCQLTSADQSIHGKEFADFSVLHWIPFAGLRNVCLSAHVIDRLACSLWVTKLIYCK